MSKELKKVYCQGHYSYLHSFAWEGSMIIYDNKYFEGIVRELNYDVTDNNYVASRKEDKEHPYSLISGYIIEDRIITFDKFPEAATPYDISNFISLTSIITGSELKKTSGGEYARGQFATITPCGNCPEFYESLYHDKDVPYVNGDLYDAIEHMFPCCEDEIVLLGEKRKIDANETNYSRFPINYGLKNIYTPENYLGRFSMYIDDNKSIKFPEDIIIDEHELEKKIEDFKLNMRKFDKYVYDDIANNKKEKYEKITELLKSKGELKEKTKKEVYVEELKEVEQEKVKEEKAKVKGLKRIFQKFKKN